MASNRVNDRYFASIKANSSARGGLKWNLDGPRLLCSSGSWFFSIRSASGASQNGEEDSANEEKSACNVVLIMFWLCFEISKSQISNLFLTLEVSQNSQYLTRLLPTAPLLISLIAIWIKEKSNEFKQYLWFKY